MLLSTKRTGNILAVLTALLLYGTTTYAIERTSTKSDAWHDPSTWSPSGVPGHGDVVTVLSAHTVEVNHSGILYGSPYPDIEVHVYGVLSFTVASSLLNLGSGSAVNIESGGLLKTTGSSPSQQLAIGGPPVNVVWKGSNGNISGSIGFDHSGSFALLPVSLLEFTAIKKGSENHIKWTTVDEKAFSHFEVERSFDGLQFGYIGQELSRGNELKGSNDYQYFDDPEHQLSYYRLKMVDLDGTFEYSDVVAVSGGETSMFSIYPNPAPAGNFKIMQSGTASAEATVAIFNISGQQLAASSVTLSTGPVSYEPPISLLAGTYILNILVGGQVYKEKLIVK